ncbi:MAG: hypothetical protein ABL860_00865 [Candidatus Nitrotoga sp.]
MQSILFDQMPNGCAHCPAALRLDPGIKLNGMWQKWRILTLDIDATAKLPEEKLSYR